MIVRKKSLVPILLAAVLSSTSAHAKMIELKAGDPTTVTKDEVYEKGEVKRINVKNRELRDVLQAIENVSGIDISVDDGISTIPVDADIYDKEWHLALQQLLRDFNIVFNFIDSKITGLKVLSLHGQPENTAPKTPIQKTASDENTKNDKKPATNQSTSSLNETQQKQNTETDSLGRPVLTEGEYLGTTRVKIRRSYPEGFRVSVMPPNQPPGFTDNTPPPGAENTMFRPPLPTPTVKPVKNIDNTPPPGSV